MARGDKGMRLTVRGLQLTGLQIVKLNNNGARDEIFILKSDLTIASYTYNPFVDVGFTLNASASEVLDAIALKGENTATAKIMEIAGGNSIKVRYDNGLSYNCIRKISGGFIVNSTANVARITSTAEYKVGKPVQYYRTGVGTAPLMSLLDGNVCAVFEGVMGDTTVTIDELMSVGYAIIGKIFGFNITQQNGVKKIITALGETVITGFGEIVRERGTIRDIHLSTQNLVNQNVGGDYSSQFSPVHYTYIERERTDMWSGWGGVGNIGYTIDSGYYSMMEVALPIQTSSGTLPDVIPFVVEGGVVKRVNVDGRLEDIAITALEGGDLITHIYSTGMSGEVALVGGATGDGTEPFSVNGYHFSYGTGYLADVAPSAL